MSGEYAAYPSPSSGSAGSSAPAPTTTAADKRTSFDITVWIVTTLVLGMVPFAVIAGFYYAFPTEQESSRLPTPGLLLGHGEALLLIFSICGTAFAEILVNPYSERPGARTLAVLFSVILTFVAGAFATFIGYGILTQGDDFAVDRLFVVILTVALLTGVVALQIVMIVLRAELPGRA